MAELLQLEMPPARGSVAPEATEGVGRRPVASVASLGCRVNQYEVRQIAEDLARRGFRIVPFGQPADVSVVNTCAVTENADAKSRQALRRAARGGDDPIVIATGCYADQAPEEVAAIPGVSAVLPNARKMSA